jgi:hypothetical protein
MESLFLVMYNLLSYINGISDFKEEMRDAQKTQWRRNQYQSSIGKGIAGANR